MKKFYFVYNFICISILLMGNAFAYLDPSVMTYTIQAVAGVAIAVGAVAGVLWRKAKKKTKTLLNIDDNAKKEVEDEVVEIFPGKD